MEKYIYTACCHVRHTGGDMVGDIMQAVIKEKLIASDKGYQVHCYRTGKVQLAMLCKNCKSMRGIDPVAKIIKCYEVI